MIQTAKIVPVHTKFKKNLCHQHMTLGKGPEYIRIVSNVNDVQVYVNAKKNMLRSMWSNTVLKIGLVFKVQRILEEDGGFLSSSDK